MKKHKIASKINSFAAIVVMTVLSVGICALAKYYKEYNFATVLDKSIIADYYIELTGDGSKTLPFEVVSLENINPGDTKNVSIIVTNGHIDESNGKKKISDTNIIYSFELVHTNNLPLKYELIDKDNNIIPYNEVNADTENLYLNTGESILYNKNYAGESFELKKSSENINSDRYILRISWDKADNDSKYVKEIDAVYLKINSYEPRQVK